jgi:hypothetical protein
MDGSFLERCLSIPPLLIRIYQVVGSTAFTAMFSFLCTLYFPFWSAVSGSGEKVLDGGSIVHVKVETASRYYGNHNASPFAMMGKISQ